MPINIVYIVDFLIEKSIDALEYYNSDWEYVMGLCFDLLCFSSLGMFLVRIRE